MPEEAFVSSVPGIYAGLLKLVREAAKERSPEVSVFPFELAQYKPATYVIVGPIKGPEYEWESIPLQMRERFDIAGKVIVYTGETPVAEENQALAVEALTKAFATFIACVMTPALANRGTPTFGTAGPNAQIVVPTDARHEAGLGIIEGASGGWLSVIDWGLHFEAILNPIPALP